MWSVGVILTFFDDLKIFSPLLAFAGNVLYWTQLNLASSSWSCLICCFCSSIIPTLPLPVHLPNVPFSFLVQMPSARQSSNKCGEIMASSAKILADHAEISPSSDDASCCSPRLPSTHTTYGQPLTSTTIASSMITLSAANLKASKTSSNLSRIPPLPNMFVSPCHGAPCASTSCSWTYATVSLIPHPSPLRTP